MLYYLQNGGNTVDGLGIIFILIIIVFLWKYRIKLYSQSRMLILSAQPIVYRESKKFKSAYIKAISVICLITFVLRVISYFRVNVSDSRMYLFIDLSIIFLVFSLVAIGTYLTGKNDYMCISKDRIEYRIGPVSECIEARNTQSMKISKNYFTFILQDDRKVSLKKGFD
jgi:hypothetical protein